MFLKLTLVSGRVRRTKSTAVKRKAEKMKKVPDVCREEFRRRGVENAMRKFPDQLAVVVMDTAIPLVDSEKIYDKWKKK